jgi:hypothetical protein
MIYMEIQTVDVEWTMKAFLKLWNEGVFRLKEREQI